MPETQYQFKEPMGKSRREAEGRTLRRSSRSGSLCAIALARKPEVSGQTASLVLQGTITRSGSGIVPRVSRKIQF